MRKDAACPSSIHVLKDPLNIGESFRESELHVPNQHVLRDSPDNREHLGNQNSMPQINTNPNSTDFAGTMDIKMVLWAGGCIVRWAPHQYTLKGPT